MPADGSDILFDSYGADTEWDGASRSVAMDAADTDPLIGMALFDGYELTIEAVVGGTVTIDALLTASTGTPQRVARNDGNVPLHGPRTAIPATRAQ